MLRWESITIQELAPAGDPVARVHSGRSRVHRSPNAMPYMIRQGNTGTEPALDRHCRLARCAPPCLQHAAGPQALVQSSSVAQRGVLRRHVGAVPPSSGRPLLTGSQSYDTMARAPQPSSLPPVGPCRGRVTRRRQASEWSVYTRPACS